MNYNESVVQINFPTVSTKDKKRVFSSNQEIKDRKNEYAHGPDANYLRALELNLMQESRQSFSNVKASNAQKDEMRNNNMAHINEFVNDRREFLKDNKARVLHGTVHDIVKVPVAIHYSKQNLNRVDGKSKRGGKRRSNRTRKHK